LGNTKGEGEESVRDEREGKPVFVAQPGKVPDVPHKRPPHCRSGAPPPVISPE